MLLASAVFSPLEYWPILAGFIAAVAVLLAFDLFVIERLTRHAGHTPEGERKRFRLSASWTVLCVLAALGAAWAFREFALRELTANPALLAASDQPGVSAGSAGSFASAASASSASSASFASGRYQAIGRSSDKASTRASSPPNRQ